MSVSKNILFALGITVITGVFYVTAVQANAPAKEEAAAREKYQSYGTTLVLAKEPVDEMFSHKTHVITYELSCDSCHPDLFEQKRGAALEKGDYTMASLAEGLYCGACHDDSTAFGTEAQDTCITCHGSDMVQPESVVFNVPVKSVIFEHKGHTEMGLACSDCHSKLFKMKVGAAEEKPEAFTMQALYDGKYCGGCHNGDDAFASDTQCTTCHIGVKGFNRRFGGSAKSAAKAEH